MQRAYIAPQKAYIAKRDTHMAAYSVTRVSRACNDRQKAAIARLARKANVFRGSGAAAGIPPIMGYRDKKGKLARTGRRGHTRKPSVRWWP